MKFIELTSLNLEKSNSVQIDCELRDNNDVQENFSCNVLTLDNGICVGVPRDFDASDKMKQLLIGYHNRDVLYFYVLSMHGYHYKFLAINNEGHKLKGRFYSKENIGQISRNGKCRISCQKLNDIDNVYLVIVKETIYELKNDWFNDLVYENIEEMYDPQEIMHLLNRAKERFKNQPEQVELEEPTCYK